MRKSNVGAGKRSGEGCGGHAERVVMGQRPDRGEGMHHGGVPGKTFEVKGEGH